MDLDALLGDDDARRADAIARTLRRPEHERTVLCGRLGLIAKEAADALEIATDSGKKAACATMLGRACRVLSMLRIEVAKTALLRLADEGAPPAKLAIARALRETTTPEGRAVLVHLLSDDDGREAAIAAIGSGPWPEAMPLLLEIAESDDHTARLTVPAIAKCAQIAGPNERAAASDFLLELLGDDAIFVPAFDALLRDGDIYPGIAARAKRLAKEPGKRKLAALCLVAAYGDEGNAGFLELALAGTRVGNDLAKSFLAPLREDANERIRLAAERTWKALDL